MAGFVLVYSVSAQSTDGPNGRWLIWAKAVKSDVAETQVPRTANLQLVAALDSRPRPPVYYSAQRNQPPLPFDPFPDLPVFDLGNGGLMYDDRDVDYDQLNAETLAGQ